MYAKKTLSSAVYKDNLCVKLQYLQQFKIISISWLFGTMLANVVFVKSNEKH